MEPVNESPRVLGNRYELGALLGRGGMAEVHLGHDGRLGRTVAIKLLRTDLARDPTFQARFRREAHSAAALNHPAIVAVYDTGEEPARDSGGAVTMLPYIVMEHVQGRTLREMVEENKSRIQASLPAGAAEPSGAGALDVGFALEVTAGVLSALEYSHRSGIVHRDIKPANVMVTPTGAVKVMDFGIARALTDSSATMTQTHAVIGTAQYLSPEQARGEQVDARSDLYSTGCLLFELLTGRPPFVGDSPVSVAYQHVREAPPLPSSINPAVPESVDRIVLHALGKDRTQRYQDAATFQQDVDAALSGRRVAAPGIGAATAATQALGHEATTQYFPPGATGTQAFGAGAMLPGSPGNTGDPYDADPYDRYPSRRGAAEPQRRRKAPIVLGLLALAALAVLAVWALPGLFSGSQDPKLVALPSVVDQPVEDARSLLQGRGFDVYTELKASDPEKEGLVVEQDPQPGNHPRGAKVTLFVGTGPDTVKVPRVVGYSIDAAEEALAGVKLTVAGVEPVDLTEEIVEDVESPLARNEVIRTEPAAGTQAKPGDSVTLVVSSGKVQVPDVEGDGLAEARDRLKALGFRVRTRTAQDTGGDPGTVVDQSTPNGTAVAIGSTITITVAERAQPTPTPTTQSPTPTATWDDPSTVSPSLTVTPGSRGRNLIPD
jgi:serine/threonine-protein kinase